MKKLGSFLVLAVACCLALTSCTKSTVQSVAQEQSADHTNTDQPNTDPAQANLAPAGQPPAQQAPVQQTAAPSQPQNSYTPQSSYQTETAPAPQGYAYNPDDSADGEPPVEAEQPPPPLLEYSQPECPGENYLWTPGYWGYASAGYYWVPGAWVIAPYIGALWTPPYWEFAGGRYHWYHGYWGPHIGFYGGINYGFGYGGRGYEGGYWNRGVFNYNRSVNNVNTRVIRNVYNYRVNNQTNVRVSYNGGNGGLNVRPTGAEMAVRHEQRIGPVAAQVQHMRQAGAERAQFAAIHHGHPQMLVAARPLATAYAAPAPHPSGVPGARVLPPVTARQEPARAPQTRAQMQPNARPAERPQPAERSETRASPVPHAPAPNTNRPAVEARPEVHPAPPRIETRPTPQSRPRMEQRSVPQSQPRVEQKRTPPPQPRAEERPNPQPRTEQRQAPPAHQEAAPGARPAPKRGDEHGHPQ